MDTLAWLMFPVVSMFSIFLLKQLAGQPPGKFDIHITFPQRNSQVASSELYLLCRMW